AWHMIFQGPAAVNGQASGKSKKSGVARMNGMKQVTIPAIAYISTLVYFALRSQETFGAGTSAHEFDFFEFYRGLVTFLEKEAPQEECQEFLGWWNKQVFPNHVPPEEETVTATSTRGLMKAQISA
ncbi:hypothetical protein K439DRAFT_1625646, partial [Ramaria rubella]